MKKGKGPMIGAEAMGVLGEAPIQAMAQYLVQRN